MNETLQAALADILVKATETAEAAGQFIVAEAPDVVQQLLAWKLWVSVFDVFCCACAIAGIVWFWKFYKKSQDNSDAIMYDAGAWTDWVLLPLLTTVCVGIPAILGIICYCEKILQILVAPKIYLIEYASTLIK